MDKTIDTTDSEPVVNNVETGTKLCLLLFTLIASIFIFFTGSLLDLARYLADGQITPHEIIDYVVRVSASNETEGI